MQMTFQNAHYTFHPEASVCPGRIKIVTAGDSTQPWHFDTPANGSRSLGKDRLFQSEQLF